MPVRSDRQDAVTTLMNAWSLRRQEAAQTKARLEESRAEHKHAQEVLGRLEGTIEYVVNCSLIACLRCEEIETNGE